MKKVGMVGWRGMVGSVLMERMSAQNDFQNLRRFFSPRPRPDKPALMWGKVLRNSLTRLILIHSWTWTLW